MKEGRKTLTRWTIEKEHENRQQDSTGDFSGLLNAVATVAKIIANQVNKGALVGALGSAGAENVQGEVQTNLDVISNEMMISQTESTGYLGAMASEEMEDVCAVPAGQVPARVRPPGRFEQHRCEHIGRHDLLCPAQPQPWHGCDGRGLFAARRDPGLRRLCALRPINDRWF